MFNFLINALALYRILRLVQEDALLDEPRAWLTVRSPKWFYRLWSCPWCLSMYGAAGVWAADRYGYFWWHPVATILALAAVAAWIRQADNEFT